ncbi:MAG: hypothetical protein RIM99_09210 [Cyclobacteriaceae bacterium]
MVRFEDYYFSDSTRWMLLLAFTGWSVYLLFWTSSQWFIAVLVVLSVFFFSTKYVTEIDTNNNVIRDLFYVFFVRSGKYIRYKELHSIRIDKTRVDHQVRSRASDRRFNFSSYTGTLLYDKYKSLELTTKTEYEWFGSEMKRLSEELQIPIQRSY